MFNKLKQYGKPLSSMFNGLVQKSETYLADVDDLMHALESAKIDYFRAVTQDAVKSGNTEVLDHMTRNAYEYFKEDDWYVSYLDNICNECKSAEKLREYVDNSKVRQAFTDIKQSLSDPIRIQELLEFYSDVLIGDNLKTLLRTLDAGSDEIVRVLLKSNIISRDDLIKECLKYKEFVMLVRFIVNDNDIRKAVMFKYAEECDKVYGPELMTIEIRKIDRIKESQDSEEWKTKMLLDLYNNARDLQRIYL